jgi:uncharacterized protein YqeY
MMKDKLQADLKTAMLARNTEVVDTLKGLKSAILYAEVAQGKREEGLDDTEIMVVLKKEAKKRQDSIDMFRKGGKDEQADKEAREKELINAYLPEQLPEEEVVKVIDETIVTLGIDKPEAKDMGRIIGAVKATGAEIDGGLLATLVKSRISS